MSKLRGHQQNGHDCLSENRAANRRVPCLRSRTNAKDWCKLYRLQQSFDGGLPRFTVDEASLIIKEWCYNMQYLYDFWITNELEPDLPFPEDVMGEYAESEDFIKLYNNTSKDIVKSRIDELRRIEPKEPMG